MTLMTPHLICSDNTLLKWSSSLECQMQLKFLLTIMPTVNLKLIIDKPCFQFVVKTCNSGKDWIWICLTVSHKIPSDHRLMSDPRSIVYSYLVVIFVKRTGQNNCHLQKEKHLWTRRRQKLKYSNKKSEPFAVGILICNFN